jgi:hypothetical protein
MAAGLTDHPWSVSELLICRVAPSAWVATKRRGRPHTVLCPLQNHLGEPSSVYRGVLC